MGLTVVERKKPTKTKRTLQISPMDFMMAPDRDRAKDDAEILVKAAEIKQDRMRYNAAKKLIRGAINL